MQVLVHESFNAGSSVCQRIEASSVGATGATKSEWLWLRLRLRTKCVALSVSGSGSTPLLLGMLTCQSEKHVVIDVTLCVS